jgi:MYND finger
VVDGITCVILTIPRAEIQPWHDVYDVYVKAGRGDFRRYNMTFQLSLIARKYKYDQIFSGTLPLFGQLNVRGRSATLAHDSKGWEGESDLHICTYVPTEMVRRIKPENIIVSVRLMAEISVVLATRHNESVLKDKYFKIFRAPMLNEAYVHLVDSFPGLESPSPMLIVSPVKSSTIIDMSYPELQISKKLFTTRLTFRHGSDQKHLKNSKVTVEKITPYTITIAMGYIKYCFSFPFPIVGTEAHIRISNRSGYIEVEAPLWSHSNPNVGGYSTNPFPIVRDSDGTLCNWNMSSANRFAEVLPMLNLSRSNSRDWLDKHSSSMLSARERQLIKAGKPENITSFKITLQQIFTHVMDTANRVIEIRVSRESRASMFFFFTGMFLDDNTHGVVAEAYVLITTPDSELLNLTTVVGKKSIVFVVGEPGVSQLKKVLPAVVERARNYDHKSDCAYLSNKAPLSVEHEESPICSCGNGKVSKEILDVKEWTPLTVAMTRCAISPIFTAPFVEDTRVFGERKKRPKNVNQTNNDEGKCPVCGKEGTKRCGQCMKISYCSRECQRKDWKNHKKNCGPTDESVTATFPR